MQLPPLPTALLLLTCLMAAPARAADHRYQPTTSPATRPVAWYARLEPFTDPDFDGVRDEPVDPMYSYLESLGQNYRPADREQAFRILLSTTVYAGRRVGSGWNESKQAKAFQTLVRESDARELFEDLFRRGQAAGRLYALVYFRKFDAHRFDELAAPLIKSDEKVWTEYGCITQQIPVRRVVDHISEARTYFRLTGPEPHPKPLNDSPAQR